MSYSGHSNPPWQRNSLRGSAPTNVPNLMNMPNLQNPINPQNSVVYQNTSLYTANIRIQHQSSNQNLQYPYNNGTVNQLTPSQPYYTQSMPAPLPVQYPNQASRGLNPVTYPISNNIQPTGNNIQQQHEGIASYSSIERGSHSRVGERVPMDTYKHDSVYQDNHRIHIVPSHKKDIGFSSMGPSNVLRHQSPSVATYSPLISYNDNSRGAIPRRSSPGRRSLENQFSKKNSRHREDDETRRKKRFEEKDREREHLPERKDKNLERATARRSSPKRKRSRKEIPYLVRVPKVPLILSEADVCLIRQRYSHLYIPPDFVNSRIYWPKYFTPENNFSIQRPCSFHKMTKAADAPQENTAVLEPPDANHLFSAKVMLLGVPPMETVYEKCLNNVEDRDAYHYKFIHPTRVINFLVGTRKEYESMAIGGPWSPSLDGVNPQDDPNVLIKTAIRTCKALTGIDLSACTQWYKFLELYYDRPETIYKGRLIPAQLETVVIYLPDINSCMPRRTEWDAIKLNYKSILSRHLSNRFEDKISLSSISPASSAPKSPTHQPMGSISENAEPKTEKGDVVVSKEAASIGKFKDENTQSITEEGAKQAITHEVSQTDYIMKCETAGNSVEAENRSDVEMKALVTPTKQYIARQIGNLQGKLDKVDRKILENRYHLPDTPHIVVHPSRTAKNGKFECSVITLSVLLDYNLQDKTEEMFELSLFAETFNEMIMRDFGYKIYNEICQLPDKPKEKESMKDENGTENSEKGMDPEMCEEGREKSNDSDRSDKKSIKDDQKVVRKNYDDDTEDEDYAIKPGDKRKKTKLVIVNPELFLACAYFDSTHRGYILIRDLEDLFYVIGLKLSRFHVRKVVDKVVKKDAFYYKKLTHKKKTDDQTDLVEIQGGDYASIGLVKSAQANKQFLSFVQSPFVDNSDKFGDSKSVENGKSMIMYNGSMLDIDKLLEQKKRFEKASGDAEDASETLRKENSDLTQENLKLLDKIQIYDMTFKNQSRKLSDIEDSMSELNKKKNEYFNALQFIHNRTSPFFEKTNRSVSSLSGRGREREPDEDWAVDEGKDGTKVEVKEE